MDSVMLVSVALSKVAPTMKRWQIAEVMDELGVPGERPPMLRITQVFRDAAAATSLVYQGGQRVVRMKESGKDTDIAQVRDLLSHDLLNEDAAPVRIAQVKLILPRQNTFGTVHGSHALRLNISTRRDRDDQDAAAAWMDLLRADFESRESGMLTQALRKMLRSCYTSLHGVPLVERNGMYYVYSDQDDMVAKISQFQDRVTPGGSVVTWSLATSDDVAAQVAACADQYLMDLLIKLENDAVATTVSQRTVQKQRHGLRSLSAALHTALEGIAVHEKRLGLGMIRARAALPSAEARLNSLAPGGILPSVTQ